MKSFNNRECNAQYVSKIKKLYKQQSNNPNIIQQYNAILKDTNIAIENLNECINSSVMLNNMFNSIKQEDISFMKELLGVTGQGNNESLYRGYLALNGKNILELRVANHYETESVAKEKANNISQYLFQVVLITNPPKAIATDAFTQSGKLANLQIITKEITETSSEDDFIKLLKSIHDFLISPVGEYEESISKQEDTTNKENNKDNIDDSKMRKNTFRLTESQLHRMIKESVREVLKENYSNINDRLNFLIQELDNYTTDAVLCGYLKAQIKQKFGKEALVDILELIYKRVVQEDKNEKDIDYYHKGVAYRSSFNPNDEAEDYLY